MASIKSEKLKRSPAEEAAFERRVARAYQDGVSMEDMGRRFSLQHGAITDIVRKFPSVKLRGMAGKESEKA